MSRWISYLIAVCVIPVVTISNLKAAEHIPVVAASNLKAAEQKSSINYGASHSRIGLVAEAVNVVKGSFETDTRNIRVSDEVFQQELIQTNSVSATQFIFLDETILTIGPESKLIMDEMVFNPNLTKGKVVVTALKGLFTFVSGSLPSDSYKIRTPTATIGVRGTKFDLFVSRAGVSTVILRRGEVIVENLRGDIKRMVALNSATTVVTKTTQPTTPVPASPELENLFKPLSNIQGFQGKNPTEVNTRREKLENKNAQEKERVLKAQEKERVLKAQEKERVLKTEPEKKLTKREQKQIAKQKKR